MKNMNFLWLIIGCFFFTFVQFRWHMPLATWIAPVFLIRFFRNAEKLKFTIPTIPLLFLSIWLKMSGGWPMELWMEMSFGLLLTGITLLPLYLDRFFHRKYQSYFTSFIYPTVAVFWEIILGFTPLGTVFSFGATQVEHTVIIQMASILGMFGISFLIMWTAVNLNLFWEKMEDRTISHKISGGMQVYAGVTIVLILFGAFRLAIVDPSSPSVRIASLSVPHERDYWGEILDRGTPETEKSLYVDELNELMDSCFELSTVAAEGGAQIIFWSEGCGVYYESDEPAFFSRASEFAVNYSVYFAPSVLSMRENTGYGNNKIILFAPNGTLLYQYEKTISWYPTESDGIMPYADTPYGRISVSICFDNDFPQHIVQAGKNNVDIILVPSYDSFRIKEYHGQTAMIRAVENGCSMVRQSNEGMSYAVDYLGNIVAVQDYFDTDSALMYCDLPTKGVNTVYPIVGTAFMYGIYLMTGIIIIETAVILIKKRSLLKIRPRN